MAALSFASLGQPVADSHGCTSQPKDLRRLLGVLGVFSHAPKLLIRRTIRETWLTLAHESLVTKFVMRAQGDDRVAQEAAKQGDVVMLDAPSAMSKDVGPLWSSILWLACAPRAWPGAVMVGHAEDDTYLHLPGIVSHLRHTQSILPRHTPRDSEGGVRVLWGEFEVFHWNENFHLPEKTWNRYSPELLADQPCRRRFEQDLGINVSHTVVGPFAFAKGPLYFLSSALAREVAAHRAVGQEARAVIERGDDAPGGFVGTNAYEDAFIGYSVAQLVDSGEPLHYVSMPPGVYMDSKAATGLEIAAPAVAVHLYAKNAQSRPWKFIHVAHEWKLRNHCERPHTLRASWGPHPLGAVCGGARWKAWHYGKTTADASEPCSGQAVQLGTIWDERHDNRSCAHAALHAPKGVPKTLSRGIGACGATENGGDCDTDDQGAWPMAPPRHSLATCIAMCRCCERCHYISYSAQHEDCSWFTACQLSNLQQPATAGATDLGRTYTTVKVR